MNNPKFQQMTIQYDKLPHIKLIYLFTILSVDVVLDQKDIEQKS